MKIICIGRNYAEHAKELANEVPTEPVLFMKPESALLAPGESLRYPRFTTDLHYECELVLRVGKAGRSIPEEDALDHISDVTVGLDFTARDLQSRLKSKGLPWEISKAFDGSAAVGTLIPKPGPEGLSALSFELHLNDQVVQKGTASQMIFSPARLIAYASQFFTLAVGDLIFTGTPAGVGPVAVQDRLDGFIAAEKLLSVEIR